MTYQFKPKTIILYLFCLCLLSCTSSNLKKNKTELNNSKVGIAYKIEVGLPKFNPKTTANQTMYKTETYRFYLVEDFQNVKKNRYSLKKIEKVKTDARSFYEPEVKYKTIEYVEKENSNIIKTLELPIDIKWIYKEVPAETEELEAMVVDEKGKYTYENMPQKFLRYEKGYETRTKTKVAEAGKIEDQARSFEEIFKERRIKSDSKTILLYRDSELEIRNYLSKIGLDKYHVKMLLIEK